MVTERRMNEEMEETMQENWKLRRMLLIGVAVALLTTSAVAFYEAFRLISYYESLHTCPCEDLPEIVCCRLEIFAKLFGKPSRENQIETSFAIGIIMLTLALAVLIYLTKTRPK